MAGVALNDRKLAAEVRKLGLQKVKRLFEMDEKKMTERQLTMHDELLYRMSSNLIPRMSEVTGEDGEPIKLTLINYGDIKPTLPSEDVSTPAP